MTDGKFTECGSNMLAMEAVVGSDTIGTCLRCRLPEGESPDGNPVRLAWTYSLTLPC